MESISENAFHFCTDLTTVSIPKSVSFIAKQAFSGCEVSAFEVDDGNLVFSTLDGVLFNKERTELIKYPTNKTGAYVIPNGVTLVWALAFTGSKVSSIVVPDSVETLGGCAFSACNQLVSVTLPGRFKKPKYGATGELQDSPFAHDRSIKNICFSTTGVSDNALDMLGGNEFFGPIVPEIIRAPMIAIDKIYSKYKKAAFFGFIDAVNDGFCASPEIEKSYHKYFSLQKKNLYSVLLQKPEYVKYLIEHKLIPITDLKDCIGTVKNDAEIKAMLLNYQNKEFSAKGKAKQEKKEFSIPTETAIAKTLFTTKNLTDTDLCIAMYKGAILDIVVPNIIGKRAVTEIGPQAFSPEKLRRDSASVKVCLNITSVTINEGIKNIREHAFLGCEKLKNITIPNSVTNIGYFAFYECKSLKNIFIPSSVTNIGDYAFDRCRKLTIHAPAGSYAETYAKENNIPFVAE